MLLAASQGILQQGQLFLLGVAGGGILWFCYDLLRLWRRLIPHKAVWIALEDVVFFLVAALWGFLWLYPLSLGQLRVFLLLAVGTGSLLYHWLISPGLMGCGGRLMRRIRRGCCSLRRRRGTGKKSESAQIVENEKKKP